MARIENLRQWPANAVLAHTDLITHVNVPLETAGGLRGPFDVQDSLRVEDGATGSRYIRFPKGATTQRPVGAQAGDTRFNTTTNRLEYWTGTEWVTVENSTAQYNLLRIDTNVTGGQFAIPAANSAAESVALGHDLGRPVLGYENLLVCVVADAGYSVGDFIVWGREGPGFRTYLHGNNPQNTACRWNFDRQSGFAVRIPNQSNQGVSNGNESSWQIKVIVWG